jgi:3-hydroxy-9,10-secoandrosta-1,3,5(10)-triene-9,17-dione monooxygenase reductase component
VSSLDITQFKHVLSHFVTGVVVVSANSNEGLAGFTCQTFGSLSLEPMLVSFSANTRSQSWPQVRRAETLGINILASDQEQLARVFATRGADKFAGVGWSSAPGGAPLLDGALAHLEGRVNSVTTHGDHDLVVVAIDFVEVQSGNPLVYYRGGFGVLDAES